MTIEQLKNKITEKIGEQAIINSIFKTGSSLFCANHHDEDYTVIIGNNTKYIVIRDKDNKIDYFIVSQKERDSLLNFEPNERYARIYVIDELLKPICPIYGDNTVHLNLFEKADAYKKALKEDLYLRWFHPNVHWYNDEKYCFKTFWVAIIGLMMLENGSYEITDEMKNIIQKCHDGVLEKSWEEWVKERI